MANLTRSAIKAALIKLLNERPLSQITVKDIVSECGVNRNTFYYHYQGIPELIAEIVDDEADAIIQSHPTLDSLEACLEAIAQTAMNNKRAILHIYNSASRDLYEQYLWEVCGHVVRIHMNTILDGRSIPEGDLAVIHRYYTCIAFGCISWWLASGMKEDVLPSLHRISELEAGFPEEIIARCLGGKNRQTGPDV